MKTIAILLAALVLQACDMTEVPEEHRATVDSLVRADSIRKADSIAALPTVKAHAWKICLAGEDKITSNDWEDPRFWGAIKVRVGSDTIQTPDMHSGDCWDLGERVDTTHLRILSTSTATRFDSVWVQVDTLPTRFYSGWRQVLLRPDSVQVLSDSVYLDGARGMNKAHRGVR
jgi:hypothetical protein